MYRDVLIELSSINDLSLPSSIPPMSHKREWKNEVLDTGTQGTSEEALGEPRVMAGSQRASRHIETQLMPAQVTQQPEPLHQLQPPLYDSSGHISHQSPGSVSYLSSSTVDIAKHNSRMSRQGSSWLPSTVDSINPVSFFTYSNTPARSPVQALTQMQTTGFDVPLNKRTAFSNSDVQVMDDKPSAAQSRAITQAQRWDDNSTLSVSSFEYSDWAGAGWTGGVSQFHRERSKTSQLRQDHTGSHIGSQALLFQPQPQRQLLAMPALQPFVASHPQPKEQAQLPPGFMEPLLDPRQHQLQQLEPALDPQQQPAFNQDNMQIWTNVPTMTSECVFFPSLYFPPHSSALTCAHRLANWCTY